MLLRGWWPSVGPVAGVVPALKLALLWCGVKCRWALFSLAAGQMMHLQGIEKDRSSSSQPMQHAQANKAEHEKQTCCVNARLQRPV